jgi:hypothetical protein
MMKGSSHNRSFALSFGGMCTITPPKFSLSNKNNKNNIVTRVLWA